MFSSVDVEGYTVIYVWLALCTIYTTLLTITAFAVVFVLRKRRSSILKSQRPPRTPFSDLEFNVATPTDTAKSRRVSFSRRTGVAEFVTNEATTTWKNFYEEHNKTLESSGNESEVNATRQTISHIGKRIFEAQFQEVEAVQFIEDQSRHIDSSLNNINFADQLASLECTGDDRKLGVPQQKFDLSALTDQHSKIFGDDLAMPSMGEASGQIDVNFSVLHPIGSNADVKDDLDEIQQDLARIQSNVRPYGRKDISEYIEVELDMTQVAVKIDASDMSITDTIRSPKVQEVSKSNSSISQSTKSKSSIIEKDWLADKENIILNPYITPKESLNFAVNDVADEVLVFDGKKLRVETQPSHDSFRKTLLPFHPPEDKPPRRTIVLNTVDDLPNFKDTDLSSSRLVSHDSKQLSIRDDDNLSKHSKDTKLEKRRTVVYENDEDNISVIQDVPSNFIVLEKSNIITCENTGNISITQALPTNIIIPQKKETNKRKTIIYQDDSGNLSITQAINSNVILTKKVEKNKRNTILYSDDTGNISVTQPIPLNIILGDMPKPDSEKSEHDLVENVLPTNTVVEKRNDNDSADVSMTQAIPANIIISNQVLEQCSDQKSVAVEEDTADISITQAVPSNLIFINNSKPLQSQSDNIMHGNTEFYEQPGRRKTILFTDDAGDISITQSVPTNLVLPDHIPLCNNQNQPESKKELNEEPSRRKTILFADDTGDISLTQAVPSNLVLPEKNSEHISNILKYPINNVPQMEVEEPNERESTIIRANTSIKPDNVEDHTDDQYNKPTTKRKTILYEDESGNISVTMSVSSNMILQSNFNHIRNNPDICEEVDEEPNKRKTILFDDDAGNISVTQSIQSNMTLADHKSRINDIQPSNVVDSEANKEQTTKRNTLLFTNETADVSVTQMVPSNLIMPDSISKTNENIQELNKKVEAENYETCDKGTTQENKTQEKDFCSVSVSQGVTPNLLQTRSTSPRSTEKIETGTNMEDNVIGSEPSLLEVYEDETLKKSILYDNEFMSTTQTLPTNTTTTRSERKKRITIRYDKDDEIDEKSNNGIFARKLMDVSDFTRIPEKKEAIDSFNSVKEKPMISFEEKQPKKNDNDNDNKSTRYVVEYATNDIIVYHAVTTASADDKLHSKISEYNEVCQAQFNSSKMNDKDVIHEKHEEAMQTYDSKETDLLRECGFNVKEHKPIDTPHTETVLQVSTNQYGKISDNTILNKLLDMSNASMECITENKVFITQPKPRVCYDKDSVELDNREYFINKFSSFSQDQPKQFSQCQSNDIAKNQSSEGLFFIIADSENEDGNDEKKGQKSVEEPKILFDRQVKHKKENSKNVEEKQKPKLIVNLQEKIDEIKQSANQKLPYNMHYEEVVSSNINRSSSEDYKTNSKPKSDVKTNKSFKDANDTTELLEILSNMTDKTMTRESQPLGKTMQDISRRCSIAPKRQSIVLSREDLLNNISMAQAALQCANADMDDSNMLSVDINNESFEENKATQVTSVKKSNRGSCEVVKKLYFDEDSVCEGEKISPLKKTAFGESEYLKEDKAKVIPTYLKDITDDIKDLMSDLVKPGSDLLPFACFDKYPRDNKSPFKRDTELQADLITSSQIELASTSGSRLQLCQMESDYSTKTDKQEQESKPAKPSEKPKGPVLMFDSSNPLNNILLSPLLYREAHSYDPIVPVSAPQSDTRSNVTDESKFESVTKFYMEQSISRQQSMFQSGDGSGQPSIPSTESNISKPASLDQSVSVDVRSSELKNMEMNTLIAMKGNKELLDTSSSLTLVDDSLGKNVFDVDVETDEKEIVKSPLKIIFQMDDQNPEMQNVGSEYTFNDDEESTCAKSNKRLYSPTKSVHFQHSDIEITPKPVSKMQKMSKSPFVYQSSIELNRLKPPKTIIKRESISPDKIETKPDLESPKMEIKEENQPEQQKTEEEPKKDKDTTIVSKKKLRKKPKLSPKNKQVLTEFGVERVNDNYLNKEIMEALSSKSNSSASPEPRSTSQTDVDAPKSSGVSSTDSSKDISLNKSDSPDVSVSKSQQDRIDWQPDLISEMSSKNIISEYDSSVNVVAKIDMLPFMGTRDCEWDACSGDTWSFRLLHSRLRLSIVFEHSYHNALRSCVRADTPVKCVSLEQLAQDEKNQVAAMCVKFAAESMELNLNSCEWARDVPALLRRCAGICRVALRWGRAMQDAYLQLAYTLQDDGLLTLKVANVPLRSVWEIRLTLCMCSGGWPRAQYLQVLPVLAEPPTEKDLQSLQESVPEDWAHVPRTLWRVFKYLKHKKGDDDSLLGFAVTKAY